MCDGVRNCEHKLTHEKKDSGAHSDAVVPDMKLAISAIHTTEEEEECDAIVPMVRIRLVQSLRVLPSQSIFADVEVEGALPCADSLLLQYDGDVELESL